MDCIRKQNHQCVQIKVEKEADRKQFSTSQNTNYYRKTPFWKGEKLK